MRVLAEVCLVASKRIKQWTFYKRDEQAVAKIMDTLRRKI
jgi:hypothetical protein